MDFTAPSSPVLTVVVPTFNERENISPLIERIATALAGIAWQMIVVDDDSPDGTAALVKSIAESDPRISCIHRIGQRGLAGAVVDGIIASTTPLVAVVDADGQHDESLLPKMLATLRDGTADLVVGSRYLGDQDLERGLSAFRKAGSGFANWLAQQVIKAKLSDPVSGFFAIRRELVEAVSPRLARNGFKILFDIIASQKQPLRIVELPYRFRERVSGESKLDERIIIEYIGLIVAKATGDLVSPRALMFGVVGASGLVVHLTVLRLLLGGHVTFAVAQTAAAVTAMTTNFLINNAVTYRDRRLRGMKLLAGYLRFCAFCGVGLLANIIVANLVYSPTHTWWLAGAAGAGFGAIWNYVSTSFAVW